MMWLHTRNITVSVEESLAMRDQEVCRMGWILLFAWLAMIIYQTREIWYTGEDRNPDLFQ